MLGPMLRRTEKAGNVVCFRTPCKLFVTAECSGKNSASFLVAELGSLYEQFVNGSVIGRSVMPCGRTESRGLWSADELVRSKLHDRSVQHMFPLSLLLSVKPMLIK